MTAHIEEKLYQLHTDSPINVQHTLGTLWDVDTGRRVLRQVVSRVPKISKAVRFGPVAEWNPTTRVVCAAPGPMNDWNGSNGYPIVSDRARILIEEHAPDQAQFLPIVMVYKNAVLVSEPYWVLNPLVQVDCLDEESTAREPSHDPELWEVDGQPVINTSAVPPDVSLFAARYWPGFIVVRRSLRDRLRRARLSGLFFAVFPSTTGKRPRHAMVRRFHSAPRFTSCGPNLHIGTGNAPTRKPRRETAQTAAGESPSGDLIADMKRQRKMKTGRGITAARVADIERTLRVRLPADYKQFLRKYGWATFPNSDEVVGAPSRSREDVMSLTLSFRGASAIEWPQSMICISEDGRGGVYCIDTTPAAKGHSTVLYFDHERAKRKAGRLMPHFKAVAPSMEEWFRHLVDSE